ncbi:uncharacterized protein LOC126997561 [Eriocheir sinensis]|uniref:uncharacterized protein LOC126997561 n=1 Tax=Eriocheir sinensis TaxID=95602 RepID=UPI0021C82AA9|nr:uncharacterized protein LOC126997561 [Eriocheir sinensis]XP_050714687.1 uncharacterized protein LOC126997561 [Eriocheir sinensis]XP_050714688.1 uncharacterized protein LOC126997561 [Eriocheir sinensis]
MCRNCMTCGPVCLRAGVVVIAGVELLHDCLVLGLVAWRLALTSVHYEATGDDKDPQEVVAVAIEVITRSFDLVFSILLLYGVIKESKRYIMAWWWWSASCLVISVFLFIWIAVYLAKSDHLVGFPIVIFACIVALSILFLGVVRTYVKYLDRREMLPTILINEDDYDDDDPRWRFRVQGYSRLASPRLSTPHATPRSPLNLSST